MTEYQNLHVCRCGRFGAAVRTMGQRPLCWPCWDNEQRQNRDRFDAYEAEYGPYVAPRRAS